MGDILVILGQNGLNDVLLDQCLHVRLFQVRVMLGGEHNGVNGQRLVGGGVVGNCHLGFGVGAQAEGAAFADFGIAGGQRVSDGDGQGHQLRRFADGEPEHHALVACALGFVAFGASIDADRNIGGLLLQGD